MKKLAIIVPERNREEHMKAFVPHMEKFLDRQKIDFKTFIIHQDDERPFNRAKLLNIGFNEAVGYDYFAFHDIDMLPIDSDYSFPDGPTHLATEVEQFGFQLPYDGYFGGVTIFDRDSFEKINGYANEYWGWGAEDDDILYRCAILGIPTYRKGCKYRSLNHDRNIEQTPYQLNLNKLQAFHMNPTIDTIMKDGLSTLKYNKIGEKNITDKTIYISVEL